MHRDVSTIAIGTFYTKQCKDTTIMVLHANDCYEVYYRKQGYPYMFAFGLPLKHTATQLLDIAEGNVDNYADMFE